MIKQIEVKRLQIFPGAKAGIGYRTVLTTIHIESDTAEWQTLPLAQPWTLRQFQSETHFQTDQFLDAPSHIPVQWTRRLLASDTNGSAFSLWLTALIVAIQRMAGDPIPGGRILYESDDTIELAIPWHQEDIFRAGLQWALRYLLINSITPVTPDSVQQLDDKFKHWLDNAKIAGHAPNPLRFAIALIERGIPFESRIGVLQIGWGVNQRRLDSSFSDRTSVIATRFARDKLQTASLLASAHLPTPRMTKARDWSSALTFAKHLGWPVVVKPSNQDQGIAVVPGITNEIGLQAAYESATRHSPGSVIVEKHIDGDDHRMLVVGGKLLATSRRIPGGVIGDGNMSVEALMVNANADSRRGSDSRSLLISMTLDAEALSCLSDQGMSPNSIPSTGQFVRLRRTANISTGGTAVDVTANVHPDNRILAERAARVIGLDIAGVDFICPDITRSWHEVGGAICEVNAQPGFRPHWLGDPKRNVNGEIIDWMFRDRPARIPTAAITGTNGKTTTARMLHHIWNHAGKKAAVCCSQGVWIGKEMITAHELSGFPGARLLLNDSTVEAAIIELPRKGLLRFGHPCDAYDVASILNVQDDHIGVDGITSLPAMARLKAEVLERASQAVVINADDPLCLEMRAFAGTDRHILVAHDRENPALSTHLSENGEAVFFELVDGESWIVLARGIERTFLMKVDDCPATMGGKIRFNATNAAFAAALAWAQGIDAEVIGEALCRFENSFEHNPGRYNIFSHLPYSVLLDFAHNPDGVVELCDIATGMAVQGKRILVDLVGNRFRHHLEVVAPVLAKSFDQIYIAQNEQYFQKNAHGYGVDDPLGGMLDAAKSYLQPYLSANQALILMRNDKAALEKAIGCCCEGDLLVIMADPWMAIPFLKTPTAERI